MTIKAIKRIRHDGQLFQPGEVITDPVSAKTLLDAGFAFSDTDTDTDTGGGDEAVERVLLVAEAIGQLEEGEWTQEGKPNLDALSKAVGFKVDAALRVQAMERLA
jgi:hypothetical protein